MKSLRILAFVVLIANVCLAQNEMTKTENALRRLDSKLSDALNNGDPAALDQILGDDYVEVDSRGLITGKTDLMALVRARAAAPPSKSVGPEVTIDDTKLRTFGDTAVLVGRTTTRYQFMEYQTVPGASAPAPESVIQERFLKVYAKRVGRWQLIASMKTAIAKQ
jgi:ketosteroid isomerase-like protein